jgi:copper(I)-binding protein
MSGGLKGMGFLWAACLCAACLCAACLCASALAQSTAAVQIKDAWVRWLPGNLPAGGYLTLVNSGDVDITFLGAESDDYGSVSLHQSRQQGTVSTMTPVMAISVKPHATLEFASQGYHLMLMQPKKPLKPGDRIVMTLKFASGAPIRTQFELRAPGSTAPSR